MLTSLRVKNLALVEDISVGFTSGLNMITGETGAGKSILIGALDLLMGERADKSLIRTATDSCSVEAMFHLKDPDPVNEVLEELGLDPCPDGDLIIRRTIKANGGNASLVNDSPVTLQALKRLGEQLVDMHGPYDHQSLLKVETQRDILDAFGHVYKTRDAYEQEYVRLREIEARREKLQAVGGDLSEQIDILSFKVKELEEADLSEDEETAVQEEHTVFGNAQRIVELANGAVSALTDGEVSAFDGVVSATRALDELSRLLPEAVDWKKEANTACTQIRELSGAIALRVEGIEADPSRLEWLDQRLTTYQKLKRKYHTDVPGLREILESTQARLHDVQSRDEQMATLDQERDTVLQALRTLGGKLHGERVEVAARLVEAVTAELQALGFAHGRFGVDVEAGEPGPSGLDHIEFGFEPNVGEGMRPLRQIASSGEISRVMLATKAILARHDRIPLLVFDEIDANVGGETGGAVGRKLQDVSAHHQIICITHLPQVAMYGRSHHAVRKLVRDGRTFTDVQALADEARVEEIARMLGGREMTDVTLKHAREMLKSAASNGRKQAAGK